MRNTFKYCGIYTPGAKPQFIEHDIFRTIIPLKSQQDNSSTTLTEWEKVRNKFGRRFGESSEKILALIYNDQYISASVMAEIINVSERTVEKQIAKLKENGVLERIGPNKGGYWKIKF